MLDLNALRVFATVIRAGGVGAAAREFQVTQPAVSQILRRLEREFGRKLFGRAGNRLVPTEDGTRIYHACRQALDTLRSLNAAVHGNAEPLLGAVRIAALSEFSKAFLLPAIMDFRSRHPGVDFDVSYRHPYEMLTPLCHHEVDLAYTNELSNRPQIESIPIFEEDIVCVGPAPSRRLSWKDLAGMDWISCGSEDNVWFEFERAAATHGVKMARPHVQVAEMESVLMLAAQGVGYVLAPIHTLGFRSVKGLSVYQLPFLHFTRPIYACRLRTVPLGRAAQAFWDYSLLRREAKPIGAPPAHRERLPARTQQKTAAQSLLKLRPPRA